MQEGGSSDLVTSSDHDVSELTEVESDTTLSSRLWSSSLSVQPRFQ
jgi:hypothetical protein